MRISRMDVIGQNGNDGCHYTQDNRFLLGVDPGKKGAVALVRSDGLLVFSNTVPLTKSGKAIDTRKLALMLRDYAFETAYIERVHAMPNQGVSSTFNFGQCYGTVLGVLGALGRKVIMVEPVKWKGAMGLVNKTKNQSMVKANQLWPDNEFESIDQAEAAMIALYGATMEAKQK